MNTIEKLIQAVEQSAETLANSQTELRVNVTKFIYELLGGKCGYMVFNDDDDSISLPVFQDDVKDYYECISGVKVVVKDGMLQILLCTDFDEDFEDNDIWFNPYLYGEYDEYELFRYILDTKSEIKKFITE